MITGQSVPTPRCSQRTLVKSTDAGPTGSDESTMMASYEPASASWWRRRGMSLLRAASRCRRKAYRNELQPVTYVQRNARVLSCAEPQRAQASRACGVGCAPKSPPRHPGRTCATPGRRACEILRNGSSHAVMTCLGNHLVDFSAVYALDALVTRDLAHDAAVTSANLRAQPEELPRSRAASTAPPARASAAP